MFGAFLFIIDDMKLDYLPPIKTFIQEFVYNDKVVLHLEYKQATIQEFIEYTHKSPIEQYKEIDDIFKSCVRYSIFAKLLKKLYTKYETVWEKNIDKEKIYTNIMNNRYRTIESIYADTDKYRSKQNTDKTMGRMALARVCKVRNISLSDLIHNYTLEQFIWLADGVQYEANSQTKEGRWINNIALVDRDAVAERAKKTRELFKDL